MESGGEVQAFRVGKPGGPCSSLADGEWLPDRRVGLSGGRGAPENRKELDDSSNWGITELYGRPRFGPELMDFGTRGEAGSYPRPRRRSTLPYRPLVPE